MKSNKGKKQPNKEKEFKKRFENEIRVCSADNFLEDLANKYLDKEASKESETK